MEFLLTNVADYMREFQRLYSIERQCITNCQYYYSMVKRCCSNQVSVKPVFVYSSSNNKLFIHLVIEFDGDFIIEPSYEVYCLKDRVYIGTIRDVANYITEKEVKLFLSFVDISEKINRGESCIINDDIYDRQETYVKKMVNDSRHLETFDSKKIKNYFSS